MVQINYKTMTGLKQTALDWLQLQLIRHGQVAAGAANLGQAGS